LPEPDRAGTLGAPPGRRRSLATESATRTWESGSRTERQARVTTPWRRFSRGLGVLLLSAAVGFGGYMGWLLWGTGLVTARAQADLREKFLRPFVPEHYSVGDGIAIIQIPKIKLDMVVVEGVDRASLTKGPGHYPDTALPWERRGRVGIAGHRTTYLHPFWSLDKLKKGDRIRLITRRGRFDYAVTRVFTIMPWEAWVLDQTKKRTLVLTTCHPRFSAAQRLVVFADLEFENRSIRAT
jgi:sortase A